MSPPGRWALTPPFHLYRVARFRGCTEVCFLWHCLFPPKFAISIAERAVWRDLPVRKYDALRCPDFPLSRQVGTAIEWLALTAKIQDLLLYVGSGDLELELVGHIRYFLHHLLHRVLTDIFKCRNGLHLQIVFKNSEAAVVKKTGL